MIIKGSCGYLLLDNLRMENPYHYNSRVLYDQNIPVLLHSGLTKSLYLKPLMMVNDENGYPQCFWVARFSKDETQVEYRHPLYVEHPLDLPEKQAVLLFQQAPNKDSRSKRCLAISLNDESIEELQGVRPQYVDKSSIFVELIMVGWASFFRFGTMITEGNGTQNASSQIYGR